MTVALSLLGAALPLVSACGWGYIFWRRRAPSPLWAFIAGVPFLSLGVFLLLLTGQATTPALLAWCGFGLSGFAWRAPRTLAPAHPPLWTLPFLAAFGLLYLVHALAPEIQPDAAGYHLGLTAEWLRTGRFAPRIGFYELLPLGLETLFLPAIAIGGYPAAKLFHLAFLATAAPLSVQLARRLSLPDWSGWAGWLLYALTPAAGVSAASAYTDAAAVFFTLAAFTALMEWRASQNLQWLLAAGLAAGFCYAVKLPGLLIVVATAAFPLAFRVWRGAALAALMAMLSVAPWMLRAFWLTGNPIAPLGNRIFSNPYFHEGTEQYLASYLKDYGVSGWSAIPHALLFDGAALQGLLGPVWILALLGLWLLREPAGRWLWAAAVVSALPWLANAGSRFLLPALLFAGLALAAMLPRWAAVAVVALHAFLSWPAVIGHYANPEAWRLREWPWAVVTGAESEQDYLRRSLWDYRAAAMVREHVPADEPLLDLYSIPTAYSGVVGVGPLPSASFVQMADTLARAAAATPDSLDRISCAFPLEFFRAVRWRLPDDFPAPWSIREVRFYYGEHERPISRHWFLRAWPSPQDAPLACDRNPATGWHTWRHAPAGSYFDVHFGRPQPLDSVQAVMPHLRGGQLHPIVEGLKLDGAWMNLCEDRDIEASTARPLRREAIAFLRHRGIRWIVAPDREEGHGLIGRALAMAPEAWGVEAVARVEGARLFRLPH